MVSSLRHIREVNDAPRHQLSLHAVAKDVGYFETKKSATAHDIGEKS